MTFHVEIDATKTTSLSKDIQNAFAESSVVSVRNVIGAQGGRLSAYEYTNLIREIGRLWTTKDELAAEERFQLEGFPEIMRLANMALLGSGPLPLHSDASHHPARPWPHRSLLAIQLPEDGSAPTSFYDMYAALDVARESVFANIYPEDLDDLICWHQPAYGTGWQGRWNRFVELHPRSGRKFMAFDERFITKIIGVSETEWLPEDIQTFKVECLKLIREHTPKYEHHWKPNDLVLWDNRGVLHSRTAVTKGQHREMWRITFDLVG